MVSTDRVSSMTSGQGRHIGIWANSWSAFVGGLFSGLIVGIVFVVCADTIADAVRQPSCDDPGDLVLVSPTGSPEVSSFAAEFRGTNLTDGSTASSWAVLSSLAIGETATFEFTDPVDLQLICVVNGAPTNVVTYMLAGKVRSLAVRTDGSEVGQERLSPLAVLPESEIQNRQELDFDEGSTRSVTLTIRSTYDGLGTVDPEREPPQFRKPPGRTALAEVEFYRE